MKINLNETEEEGMFNNIVFNRDEIKGTDETFYNEENDKNNSECSLDLEKSESSVSSDKLDLCDQSMEEEMNKVTLNNVKKRKSIKHKITKNELNKIPIPIFECLYCADEKIVFNHLINEELSLKYLYNAEKKDIFLINFLERNNLLSYKNKNNIDLLQKNNININKLDNIIRVLLQNTEYLSKCYNINESHNYLKHKRKREKYNINILNEKYKKIKNNNICNFNIKKFGDKKNQLFEDEDEHDNDVVDNYKKIKDLKNNIIENEGIKKDEDDVLNKSIEEKFCDSFNKLLEDYSFMDLTRKIKWSDIDFEDKPYNIWEPNSIDDDNME